MSELKCDYREVKCPKCGEYNVSAFHMINVETQVDKGYVGKCECGQLLDCGDFYPEGIKISS